MTAGLNIKISQKIPLWVGLVDEEEDNLYTRLLMISCHDFEKELKEVVQQLTSHIFFG